MGRSASCLRLKCLLKSGSGRALRSWRKRKRAPRARALHANSKARASRGALPGHVTGQGAQRESVCLLLQLGSLAGLSLLTVYVGVVECAPASPYTYSSSTHRSPDERTPIEVTPLSATSAELGLGLGQGLGLDSLSHSSSHALLFFSPSSFHTLAFSPAFTSVWSSA